MTGAIKAGSGCAEVIAALGDRALVAWIANGRVAFVA
jgi:hypothetical protein